MVSLEYLPYYWKLLNHIWQLYTLGVGNFFHLLKIDLVSLSRSPDQKIVFLGIRTNHGDAVNFNSYFIFVSGRHYTHIFHILLKVICLFTDIIS